MSNAFFILMFCTEYAALSILYQILFLVRALLEARRAIGTLSYCDLYCSAVATISLLWVAIADIAMGFPLHFLGSGSNLIQDICE